MQDSLFMKAIASSTQHLPKYEAQETHKQLVPEALPVAD
jgi:hypothetical protein